MNPISRRLLSVAHACATASLPATGQCLVDLWPGLEPTSEAFLGLRMAADGEWLAVSSGVNIAPARIHLLRRQTDGEYAWQQSLTSPNPLAELDFGLALDLRGDWLAIGAPSFNHLQPPVSAVYLYRLVDGEWTFEERFTAPTEPNNTGFGRQVHLGPDGLAVSAASETVLLPPPGPAFAQSSGAVYLYREIDGEWVPDGKLVNVAPQNLDKFGTQARLTRTSSGVDQLIVGVPGEDDYGSSAGAVRIYERQGPSQWPLVQTLEPSSEANFGEFGEGVVVEGDRMIAVAPRGGLGTNANGLFHEYLRVGSTWVHNQSFEPSQDLSSSNYSGALDLRGDHLVVGTASPLTGPGGFGFFTRFERSSGVWGEVGSTFPKFPSNALSFGVSVAWLDADPLRIAVGASNDTTYGTSHGQVFQYQWAPGPCHTLFSDTGLASLSKTDSGLLRLEPPSGSEGAVYFVLGSTSGTQPGLPVDGQLLPLVVDDYFLQTLTQPNTPPLENGLGTFVGAWGVTLVNFTLPAGLDPALAGTQVHHAYVVIDPITALVTHASNALLLVLTP